MKNLFYNQFYHLLSYLILSVIILLFSKKFIDNESTIFGIKAFNWVLISWVFAALMQAWIMFFWRLELYLGLITRWFGKYGFTIFRTGFIVFSIIRLFSVIPISILTKNTIEINFALKWFLIIATTPLIIWGIYSVYFYFGINRAFGADHFFKEYQSKTLEKRGIFKYIRNSMYTIVTLLLYHPGLFFESSLGLFVAFIQHLFIWVHYFCTERPDIKFIYFKKEK